MRHFRRKQAIVIALCACAVSLAAQQSQTTFKSKIELVNIDVVVVDKDGHAVRGLTQKDFALTDRKKPQTIATFEEISHERPAAGSSAAASTLPASLKLDVASNVSVQADRLVMVVVDDLHIWKGRTDKARELARDIITNLGGNASMALLFTSGEHSTQITEDRSELLAAAASMTGRQSVRRPHQANDVQKAARIDAGGDALAALDTVAHSQSVNLQDFEDNMQDFKTMQDAARMLLSETQRRKSFVLVSEGMLLNPVGAVDRSSDVVEVGERSSLDGSTESNTTGYHTNAVRDMVAAMRKSNVAMYAIDPRGKVRPEDMNLELFPGTEQCAACTASGGKEDSSFRWDSPIRIAQDGLSTLATAAGGFAVTDTNDFAAGLQRIVEDIDHYYLLGFYPIDTSGSADSHPVGLTLPGHPDYTVRFRRGYTATAPASLAKNKDPLVDLAAGVLPKSDLPLRLTALPLAGKGKTANVVVALEITAPTALMKDTDAKLRDDVTYSILVVDDKKAKVTSRTGQAAKLSLSAKGGDMPDSVAYQIPLTLNLDPGRYQLRASAMSKKMDRGGSVYLDIVVPDFSKSALALSGIALGFADGARVPVGRTASASGTGGPAARGLGAGPGGIGNSMLTPAQVRSQTQANLLPFEPTLSREFGPTDALRAYFEVVRGDAKSTVALTITIVNAEGKAMLAIDRAVAPNDSGKMDIRVPLEPLGPGAFRLRVTATDSHAVARTETGFVIK